MLVEQLQRDELSLLLETDRAAIQTKLDQLGRRFVIGDFEPAA